MLAPPLPARARSVLGDPAAEVSFSVVSLWEIVIKLGLGRPDIQVDVAALRTNARLSGIEEVPVYGEHVLAVKDLPPLHQDPFDRLLVAQAPNTPVRCNESSNGGAGALSVMKANQTPPPCAGSWENPPPTP